MSTATPPDFISRDVTAITSDLIAQYESVTGKVLYPAQPERLLIDLIAYAKVNMHIGIQGAAEQMLVRFASAPALDYLGDLDDNGRIQATSAGTTLRFSVLASLGIDVAIPAGVRCGSSDGKVVFATSEDAVLMAGSLDVDVPATCETAGSGGNGFAAGQINVLISDVGDGAVTVSSIVATSGGADEESDEAYRARLMSAPDKRSVAGPAGAYRRLARDVSQDISDVGVIGPTMALVDGVLVSTNAVPPGAVYVYVLMAGGGDPSADVLSRVQLALSSDTVRPLCDFVQAWPAVAVDYQITAHLIVRRGVDIDAVLAAARSAAQGYADGLSKSLGIDVVPSQQVAALSVSGVYSVELVGAELLELDESQWARCTGINIVVTGVARG